MVAERHPDFTPASQDEAEAIHAELATEVEFIREQIREFDAAVAEGRAIDLARFGRDHEWRRRAVAALMHKKAERRQALVWVRHFQRQRQDARLPVIQEAMETQARAAETKQQRLLRLQEEEQARMAAWRRQNGAEDPTALHLLSLLRWQIGAWASNFGVVLPDDLDGVMLSAKQYCIANDHWPPEEAR